MANEITYPFDPTGSNPLARISNEQHAITSVNFRQHHFVVPRWAPFFAQNLVLGFQNPDGSARTLVEGVDYYLGFRFIDASKACAKPIYGAIQFLDKDLQGVLTLSYQTVGGNWTVSEQKIVELLANNLYNPRSTSWEQVVERPVDFPVIGHEWDLVDMVGASELVSAIDDVREAITQSTGGGLETHVANKSNPHEVTALQVGLGNVQNYPLATILQAQSGTNTTSYMTPFLTAQAINALGQSNLNSHIQNQNNPHFVTAEQVGLGNVPNFLMATNQEALTGTATNRFMSPALTAAVIAVVNQALNDHINNSQNPHQTTKEQISLFNVQNYPVATAQQAQDGTDNQTYMTPLRTKQAILTQSQVGLQNHVSDYTNPHNVTKGQVGLLNVDNYATASAGDAINNTSTDKFMTPQRTAQAISFFVGNDFLNHLNASNPHNVNATQIGLGNVPNFLMATAQEAQTGTESDRFMSPLRTAQAITSQIGTAFQAHTAQTNPHATTKADVGLGNVQNFAVANDPEAAAGLATNLYLTPRGGAQLMNAIAGGHFTNNSNPHNVTAAQVGLGSVQNFAIATDAEASTGNSNSVYVTVRTAKLAANTLVDAHANRSDNPHAVTKSQVGLGNVQDFPVATAIQAQGGTEANAYMTPQRTAQAITTLGTALVNTHASRTDNPHAVTAGQVGAYTISQVDQLLLAKLGTNQVAADSNLLQGNTLQQVIAQVNASSVTGALLSPRDVDASNNTGYTWALLGNVKPMLNTANSPIDAKPDLIWLISGGEAPTSDRSGSWLLSLSIRQPQANGYVSYSLVEQVQGPSTGAPEFGYIYDDAAKTASIYVRMSTSNNPITIVELNHGGGVLSPQHLGYANPPTPIMMVATSPAGAAQAQITALTNRITQLENDIVNGFAALQAAINNL